MRKAALGLGICCFLLLASAESDAGELRPETLDAWNKYVAAAQQRMAARLGNGLVFLWADEAPERSQRLKQGEIEVAPVNKNGAESVPHGLIHDWIGAVFIPDTTIDRVSTTLRDYGRYKEMFPPTVVDSRVIERSGATDQYSIRWVNKVLFVNAAVDAECLTTNVHVDDHRFYATSYSTKLQEIQNYGEPSQHILPPDQGNGYVWRLYSFARYEERDGGVYLEIEALALTRDIPVSLRFIVAPEVKKLSRNSLLVSLRQSRAAVHPSAEPLPVIVSGSQSDSSGPSLRAMPAAPKR